MNNKKKTVNIEQQTKYYKQLTINKKVYELFHSDVKKYQKTINEARAVPDGNRSRKEK